TVDASTAGAQGLTVNTGGKTIFNGAVGTTALKNLVTDGKGVAGEQTQLKGNVTTANEQTYGDAVVVNADVVATSTGDKDITFQKTVDAATAGAEGLTVNTGGKTIFNGVVGAAVELGGLTTDSAGETDFNMDASTSPAGKAAVNVAGKVTINDKAVFNVANSGSGSHATVLTTGVAGAKVSDQIYNGAVTLGKDTVFQDNSGNNIEFNGAIDGANALVVNSSGNEIFNQPINVGSIITDDQKGSNPKVGGRAILADGHITTSGNQTFNDLLTLQVDSTLTSSGGGSIVLAGGVNGNPNASPSDPDPASTGHTLELVSTGNKTLGGTISGVHTLQSLEKAGSPGVPGSSSTTFANSAFDNGDTLLIVDGHLVIQGGSVVQVDHGNRLPAIQQDSVAGGPVKWRGNIFVFDSLTGQLYSQNGATSPQEDLWRRILGAALQRPSQDQSRDLKPVGGERKNLPLGSNLGSSQVPY
ncbi:MAG TPA: hypothetical protein VLT36_06390, partial [Candidatus Dormibacteraeota bacterium]|nr:hypothetical protein [Candidatus Dormibacteraeota bacterium]